MNSQVNGSSHHHSNSPSPASASATPNLNATVPANRGTPDLAIADLKLLHFWVMNTSSTCSASSHRLVWQSFIVELGFRNHFLLRGIMALAAIHKAVTYPPESEDLFTQSSAHMHIALRELRTQLENPEPASVSAVFALSGLLVPHSMGCAQVHTPQDPINDLCHWMRLIKGVQAMVEPNRMRLITSEVGVLIMNVEQVDETLTKETPVNEIVRLKDLVHQRLASTKDQHQEEVYLHTIDELHMIYLNCLKLYDTGDINSVGNITLRWVATTHPTILDLIENRDQLALVILAHYAVLFRLQESSWWMKGWGRWTIDAVRALLQPDLQQWTEWPLEKLRNVR